MGSCVRRAFMIESWPAGLSLVTGGQWTTMHCGKMPYVRGADWRTRHSSIVFGNVHVMWCMSVYIWNPSLPHALWPCSVLLPIWLRVSGDVEWCLGAPPTAHGPSALCKIWTISVDTLRRWHGRRLSHWPATANMLPQIYPEMMGGVGHPLSECVRCAICFAIGSSYMHCDV